MSTEVCFDSAMKNVLKRVYRAMMHASIDVIGVFRFLRRYPRFLNERNALVFVLSLAAQSAIEALAKVFRVARAV